MIWRRRVVVHQKERHLIEHHVFVRGTDYLEDGIGKDQRHRVYNEDRQQRNQYALAQFFQMVKKGHRFFRHRLDLSWTSFR